MTTLPFTQANLPHEESVLLAELKNLRKYYDPSSVSRKADLLSKITGVSLRHIKGCTYDTSFFKGNIENPIGIIQVPLGIAGPLWIEGQNAQGEFFIPLATTEGALVLTYDLGMRLLRMSGPVYTEVLSKFIHISPMFPIKHDEHVRIERFVEDQYDAIKSIAEQDSSHTILLGIDRRHVDNNMVLRFRYDTCDAHGLNMINHATFNACKYIEKHTGAFFYLRSHYSAVKHHSLLNEREGYGRVVKASTTISARALKMLGVTASELKDFCDRCIACATAAEVASVNVHASNAISAIFMACGQDIADISSSHVCSGRTMLVNGGNDLFWECTLRNLLVGTVGGGTHLATQSECLKILGCLGNQGSDKFAEIIAGTVLAGEFTTAAAVINRTYVDIHNKYGRNKIKHIP